MAPCLRQSSRARVRHQRYKRDEYVSFLWLSPSRIGRFFATEGSFPVRESQLEEDARREERGRKKRWRALEDKVGTGIDAILCFPSCAYPNKCLNISRPGLVFVRLPDSSDAAGKR